MSQDQQKTYDAQTAKFLAVLVQNMPLLTRERMQSWIERPKDFQRVLTTILTKDPGNLVAPEKVTIDDPDSKAKYIDHDEEPLSVSVAGTTSRGSNPFELLPMTEDGFLRLGVEYQSDDPSAEPVLRPWLSLYVGDDEKGDGAWVTLRSLDYWQGRDTAVYMDLVYAQETVLTRFLYDDLEKQYADSALSFLGEQYKFALSSDETLDGWEIYLLWLKDGVSRNSFRFLLKKSEIAAQFKKAGKSLLASIAA